MTSEENVSCKTEVEALDNFHKLNISFEDIEKKFETFLDKNKVTIFRLDGHGFSKFTSHFKKPFDENFTLAMRNTALKGLENFDFKLGFVGSDEISYVIVPSMSKIGEICDIRHNGRIQKFTTLLAGFISVTFYKEFSKIYDLTDYFPYFDCRVFQVDTLDDAIKNISDRIKYTLKNSRMMFAQSYFSQKQLNNISSKVAVEQVLKEKGIDFYNVVVPEIRLGSVLTMEPIEHEKEVDVKGEKKQIKFIRNIPKATSLSPFEAYDKLTANNLII